MSELQKRRYVVLVGDGMADYPIDELEGKTPLQYADTPNMDLIASEGERGLVLTVPEHMEAGSDVANMSLLGYDPKRYHTGRAPLEAASMGLDLGPEMMAVRCNLVTLSFADSKIYMEDYSAGHISTEEACEVIERLKEKILRENMSLHCGVSYRHLLILPIINEDIKTYPPHDLSGQEVQGLIKENDVLWELVRKSWEALKDDPVNKKRVSEGKPPANSVWFWGEGVAPSFPLFREMFGINGAVISAVDLIKGLGRYAGLEIINVPGATGYIDTNYKGKVEAAIKVLESKEFVYLHVEAPDEMGHEGDIYGKIKAIEAFDKNVVGPIIEYLSSCEYPSRIMVTTDHLTPITEKTHIHGPVPFAWADMPVRKASTNIGFFEWSRNGVELFIEEGHKLMPHFLGLELK